MVETVHCDARCVKKALTVNRDDDLDPEKLALAIKYLYNSVTY
jgi:hypothetical protein